MPTPVRPWADRGRTRHLGKPLGLRWAPPTPCRARVVRHDGIAVLVASANDVDPVPLRPTLPPLAVGDWLLVYEQYLVDVLPDGPRCSNVVIRPGEARRSSPPTSTSSGSCCGVDRRVKAGRIQRMVVQVFDAGAMPIIVLTKSDLLPNDV